jgi:hypothetical protein
MHEHDPGARDLRQLDGLGPVANEIMFEDADDFAGKVDRFLSDDRCRRELTREIGALVRDRYGTESLFANTVPDALQRLSANRKAAAWTRCADGVPSAIAVAPAAGAPGNHGKGRANEVAWGCPARESSTPWRSAAWLPAACCLPPRRR